MLKATRKNVSTPVPLVGNGTDLTPALKIKGGLTVLLASTLLLLSF